MPNRVNSSLNNNSDSKREIMTCSVSKPTGTAQCFFSLPRFERRKARQIFGALTLGALFCLDVAWGDIPNKLEAVYFEAVLAFNGKDYNKSLQILDALVQQDPNTPEFLELKALVLKNVSDDKKSEEVYKQLIKLKKDQNKSLAELGPYYYELGTVLFKENKQKEAKEALQTAIEAGINATPSHFYIGMIDFNSGRWSEAETHFKEVAGGVIDELVPPAYFYLGQVYMNLGVSPSATQAYSKAREKAKSQMENKALSEDSRKIAKQIFDAVEVALKPFDRSGIFANATALTGYDTNVLTQGVGATSASPSNMATVKQTLTASIGYSSSPLGFIQYIPSFRTYGNYNFNQSTAAGESLVNSVSLYLTRDALSRFSYGLKVDGAYSLQDRPDSNFNRNFQPASRVLTVGPYSRIELLPKLIVNIEANAAFQTFTADDSLTSTPSYMRSGTDLNGRISARYDQGNKFWNPGGSLFFDRNLAKGSEFSSIAGTIEVNDVMHITDKFNLNLSTSFGISSFSRDPNPVRFDLTLIAGAGGAYRLTPQLSVLLDLQYTNNLTRCTDSTVVDLYQYNRFVVSSGASYFF